MNRAHDSARPDADRLFERARQGDQDAWRDLFEECYPKVLRVIRRRLGRQSSLRSLYDSSDFANDVWKSLAAKSDRFDFPSIQALISFLMQAAEQKLIDERRRLHTQKRDIDRERRLEAMAVGDEPYVLASGDPTPSQFAQEVETREWLLAGRSGAERRVIELRDQGYDNEEIAEQTGWHVRKVQRFLKDLKEQHDSWRTSGPGRGG